MNDDFCGDENFICYYMYDSFLYFISGFMVVVTFSFGVLEVVFDEVLRTNHLSLKSKMAQKHCFRKVWGLQESYRGSKMTIFRGF